MNALDAVRATVTAYEGGAESLAPRMGMTGPMLRAKLNASDRNHFYLADAELMLELTGDHRLLHTMAANLGYTLAPIAADEGETAAPVLALVLEMGKTGGAVNGVIIEAMADGKITPNEMAAITRASHADQAALIKLVSRLYGLSAECGRRDADKSRPRTRP